MMTDWARINLESLAGYISEGLRDRGIDTVLVGGACVSIYSKNRYQSYDLDFVTHQNMKAVRAAMRDLGFGQKGKYFVRDDCPWMVEFVAPPVAVGEEPISKFEERLSSMGKIRMLRVEDSVKDRLASYFHWDDRQGLEQAVAICLERDVDLAEVKQWSLDEGHEEKYRHFSLKLVDNQPDEEESEN